VDDYHYYDDRRIWGLYAFDPHWEISGRDMHDLGGFDRFGDGGGADSGSSPHYSLEPSPHHLQTSVEAEVGKGCGREVPQGGSLEGMDHLEIQHPFELGSEVARKKALLSDLETQLPTQQKCGAQSRRGGQSQAAFHADGDRYKLLVG